LAKEVEEKMHVRRRSLRILVFAAAIVLVSAASLQAQQPRVQSKPGVVCSDKDRRMGRQDLYYFEVLRQIEPPDWKDSLISITVGGEKKLVLWTDGKKFSLLTDTPETTRKNIYDFFLDLDHSCRLPSDPAKAVGLIKIKWESKDLSSAQFADLHRTFTNALLQYVSNIQDRYTSMIETQLSPLYLDAVRYTVVYDNHYAHSEVDAWDVPENGKPNPMVNWVHELKKLGEDSFHRSFVD
jgi:hypothetical protein